MEKLQSLSDPADVSSKTSYDKKKLTAVKDGRLYLNF